MISQKNKRDAKKETSPDLERLMWALQFAQADLDANRRGRLSETQRTRLAKRKKIRLLPVILLALVVIPVFGCLFWLLGWMALTVAQEDGQFLPTIFLAGILTLAGWFVLRKFLTRRCLATALRTGEVEIVQGTVALHLHLHMPYRVRIGDLKFRIDEATFFAFKNREPYTLYYVCNRLLAAEPLVMGDETR